MKGQELQQPPIDLGQFNPVFLETNIQEASALDILRSLLPKNYTGEGQKWINRFLLNGTGLFIQTSSYKKKG